MTEPTYNATPTYNAAPGGVPGAGLPEHPSAGTVFILAIVGIFTSGLLSLIAWIWGGNIRKEILAQNPPQYTTEGKLKTGILIGKIVTILGIIGMVLGLLLGCGSIMAAMSANNG